MRPERFPWNDNPNDNTGWYDADEADAYIARLEDILRRGGRFIPHIPTSYESGMGGCNMSPCVADCPACALEKLRPYRNQPPLDAWKSRAEAAENTLSAMILKIAELEKKLDSNQGSDRKDPK